MWDKYSIAICSERYKLTPNSQKIKAITIFILALIFDLINNFKKGIVWDTVYEKWRFVILKKKKYFTSPLFGFDLGNLI